MTGKKDYNRLLVPSDINRITTRSWKSWQQWWRATTQTNISTSQSRDFPFRKLKTSCGVHDVYTKTSNNLTHRHQWRTNEISLVHSHVAIRAKKKQEARRGRVCAVTVVFSVLFLIRLLSFSFDFWKAGQCLWTLIRWYNSFWSCNRFERNSG